MPDSCNPMDCSPPGPSVHGLSQAGILGWVAIPFPGDLPDPGIELVSCICRRILYHLSHQGIPKIPSRFARKKVSLLGFSLGWWNLKIAFIPVQSLSCVSLQPCRPQHARLPCPSPTPRTCSNSCPSSQWCYPTISSSVVYKCMNYYYWHFWMMTIQLW